MDAARVRIVAEQLIGLGTLHPDEPFRGSPRAVVRRMRADDGTTVIVKAFRQRSAEWAREAAALTVLRRGLGTPRLIACSAEPAMVIMSDLGEHDCVADMLLGTDPVAAKTAVIAWARALGRLHARTCTAKTEFVHELAARDAVARPDISAEQMAESVSALRAHAAALGVTLSPAASAEIEGIARLLDNPAHAALSPGDACPDNNKLIDGEVGLLDFEGAEFRHIAWDVSYLTVPWASCWCAWRMPADVSIAAVDAYRDAARPALPYVDGDCFDRDVGLARVGWALRSTSWYLVNALGSDPVPSDPQIVAPRRRAMILDRLRLHDEGARQIPAVAAFTNQLRERLVRMWGEVELQLAPAFR
jgi:aminoglycoside/choline kinase family phosphotransferase